jgi:NADPH2:quinone reductase
MKAIVVHEWMEPSALAVSEIEAPGVQAGCVLIDVAAAACNFFDTLIVRGKYQVRPEFPFTPGGEVAGVVAGVGDGVTGFAVGDRVMASVSYGGYAERINAPHLGVHAIPNAMRFEEAAAFPLVYGTSHVAVCDRGGLGPDDTLLVTAAAGGIGLAAVQIGRAMGARVIALAGGADKLEIVRKAGADVAIDYREEDWIARVKEETGGKGADVIIENVGGEIFEGCMKSIAWGGRLVVVGFAGGDIPSVRANRILLKHIALVGVHFGPMLEHEPETLAAAYRDLFRLYEAGVMTPLIFDTYPLERLPDALAALEGRKTWGKLVITL